MKNKIYYDAFPNSPELSKMLKLTKNENPQEFIGKWLNKKRWYSICSMHHNINKDCNMCQAGNYHNVYLIKMQQIFHKISEKIKW